MADNPFAKGKLSPIAEMGEEALREEVEGWRAISSWIGDEVEYYLRNVGVLCRVVTRTNKSYLGTLGRPHFTISEIEVAVQDSYKDYDLGKRFYEEKTLRLPIGSLALFEVVHERVEEEEDPGDSEVDVLGLVAQATGDLEGGQANGAHTETDLGSQG